MTKMRRFPVDLTEAERLEQDEVEAPPTARKRPADKRWKRPHDDKSDRKEPTDG
jgi:hypothetical protein